MAFIQGTPGPDYFDGRDSADQYYGAGGIDTISYLLDIDQTGNNGGVTVNLTTGRGAGGRAEGDQYAFVLNATGTDSADQLGGDEYGNNLKGAGGDDLLKGMGGDDVLDADSSGFDTDKDTLTGGAGNDVYMVDSLNDLVNEALGGSGVDTVQTYLSYDLSNSSVSGQVENLSLSGDQLLTGFGNGLDNQISGTTGANLLAGRDGNDTLIGGLGSDTMRGGAGNDTYDIDEAGDRADESVAGSTGLDTVRSSISMALAVSNGIFGDVENLVLTGTGDLTGGGNGLDNAITGNAGANLLTGLGGNDTLDGGTGADTLRGGAGNDTYVVDQSGDRVDETASGGGLDLVRASATFDLAAQPGTGSGLLEHLVLTGAASISGYGNGLANSLTGNDANNTLEGRAGHDTLDGGIGADILIGGTGNDVYKVDSSDDYISELAGEGADIVHTSASYALAADASVESLGVRDAAATASIDLTGNDIAQRLTGNAGSNTLDGKGGHDTLDGGQGSDFFYGGTGNDVFYVDTNLDRVRDLAGEGFDTVYTTASFGLFVNAEIEVLRTANAAAATALTLSGNDFTQLIAGNAGANRLEGDGGNDTLSGGAGADTMIGGTGNDLFYVENAGDVTTEAEGEGIDLVSSTISRTLSANIENLNLNGVTNIDGNGNTGANVINGSAANNILRGYEGADMLNGGAGNDILLGGTSSDKLNPGNDTVHDIIRFGAVADSTGSLRDIVTGMDLNGEDRFDFTVVPISLAYVGGGTLSLATINANLATAVNANLAVNGAVLFDPSSGDLNVAGHLFLVVDANGDGNYTPNADFVVQLINATGALSLDDFI